MTIGSGWTTSAKIASCLVLLSLTACGGGGSDDTAESKDSNSPPSLSGTPSTTATVGQTYTFQPTASDANNDKLTFSITNKPGWATFDENSGRLSGTPNAAGTFADIIITVTDGKASTSLAAFTINVTGQNHAPTISGSPSSSVMVGASYSFQPSANDADGDTLVWSIENKPTWANFSEQTGLLSGSPKATDVGTTTGIRITVSDGKASASLNPFSITVSQSASTGSVTLDWTPPTQNTDGSALTNLAGYRILYGTSPTALTKTITVNNPSVSSYVVENLTSATWYFAIKVFNTANVESAASNPVSAVVP